MPCACACPPAAATAVVPVVPCATPDTEVAFIDPAQYVAGPHSSCSILGTVRTPLLFACRLADALQCTRSVPGPLAELGADWVLDGLHMSQ